MLFWLGEIEFETPTGRFILTADSAIRLPKRRRATKEEAAQIWPALEAQLMYASYDELLPWYELYWELTSERLYGYGYGPGGEPRVSDLLRTIEFALWSEQLHLEVQEPYDPLPELDEWEPPPLENLRKLVQSQSPSELWGRRDSAPEPEVHFSVRLVDETEQPLPDVHVTFTHAGYAEGDLTTRSGIGEYSGIGAPDGTVIIESVEMLEELLTERWKVFRTPKLLDGPDVTRITLHEAEKTTAALTHDKLHTIQIVPELGCIYLELVDKSARISHANCPYQIVGPEALSGTTDEYAQLKHDDVFPGKYTLTLDLDGRTYTTEAVVQPAGASTAQLRKLAIVPRSIMASVRGFVFEKNKAFVMPAVIESLQEVRDLFLSTAPNEILVVGHADTTADAKTNDPLSLSRADCAKAMMLGDVNAWLAMYGTSVLEKHRWGNREDGLMIAAMPDYAVKPKSEGSVWWYQRTRGLKQDGDCGKNTRTKLIEEYMALVGEPLSKDAEFTSPLTTHGCGENFPLDDTGADLDAAAEDGKEDAVDRRVEFFFFDAEYGIVPPATTKNSKPGSAEYPKWREGASNKIDLEVPPEIGSARIRLHDAQAKTMPNVKYRYRMASDDSWSPVDKTDTLGWADILFPYALRGREIEIEWAPLSEGSQVYRYRRVGYLNCKPKGQHASDKECLNNLGYLDETLDDAVTAFQTDYKIRESGYGNSTKESLRKIYRDRDCDASRTA